jgi:hypothetical protein
MTETDTGRLDPRYDPRFQRGYAGAPATDAAADATPPEAELDVPRPDTAIVEPQVDAAVDARADAAVDARPDAAVLDARRDAAVDARPDAAVLDARPDAAADATRPADPAQPSAAGADPAAASVPALDRVDRAPEVEASDASGADPWFVGAWALSAVVLVVGAGLIWGGVMTQEFFGPTDESDRLLQLAGWTIGPALVQVGLLGVVGMLGWSGVRYGRRVSRDPVAGGPPASEAEAP